MPPDWLASVSASPPKTDSRAHVHRFAVALVASPQNSSQERVRNAGQRRSIECWPTSTSGGLHCVPCSRHHSMRPDLMSTQPMRWIGPHHVLDQLRQLGTIIQFNLLEVVLPKVVPRLTPAKHSNHQFHQSTRIRKPIADHHRDKQKRKLTVLARQCLLQSRGWSSLI